MLSLIHWMGTMKQLLTTRRSNVCLKTLASSPKTILINLIKWRKLNKSVSSLRMIWMLWRSSTSNQVKKTWTRWDTISQLLCTWRKTHYRIIKRNESVVIPRQKISLSKRTVLYRVLKVIMKIIQVNGRTNRMNNKLSILELTYRTRSNNRSITNQGFQL